MVENASVENADVAQARALLGELYAHVVGISDKLEAVERRDRPTSARGVEIERRRRNVLRQEFYQTHRLIDGLHGRFPETRETAHSAQSRLAQSRLAQSRLAQPKSAHPKPGLRPVGRR